MKKLVISIIIFITILIAFAVYLTLTGREISVIEDRSDYDNFEYHFVIITQQYDDTFWSEVEEGARSAAKNLNVAIQCIKSENTNVLQEIELLELAIASRVDGIITYALEEDKFVSVINKAVERDIPVITIDTDVPKSKRISYVGVNNYAVGEKAANELLKEIPENPVIGIVADNHKSNRQNIMIQGFVDELSENKIEVKKVIDIYNSDAMEAMDKTQLLINSDPKINILFCTNSVSTIGAARAIVDLNLVGEVKIIGFGDHPEIRRFVEKGVVSTIIVRDPYLMGKLAVENLNDYKKGKPISEFINTDVKIITRENIMYLKNRGGDNGVK